MKSLDLNRTFYHECVAAVLEKHCPQVAQCHAAALIGWGSEVLGNDDELSKKYGWGPRVILFLPHEDHQRRGKQVFDALQIYIPETFQGMPVRFTNPDLGAPQPTTDKNGVLAIPVTTCEHFMHLYLGLASRDLLTAPLTSKEWLLLPEAGLLRLTAGEVFYDGAGTLTWLRDYFQYFPDDVWRYRLAYQWMTLSWDIDLIGLCAHRGDTLSARMATAETVKRIMYMIFLLNKTYKPGYLKWLHRQFYKLPYLATEIGPQLDVILTTTDCRRIPKQLYPILDILIEFQCQCANLPTVDYQQSPALDRGFFAYDVQPVITSLRESITGELQHLPFKIGALDQWISDQDLLIGPTQLKTLQGIYECDDPMLTLFTRHSFADRFL